MKNSLRLVVGLVLLIGLAAVSYRAVGAQAQARKMAAAPAGFDATIRDNSARMMKEGQQVFRFDTFGSEAFWGDALQIHKAIAGEKNGGVGATDPGGQGRPG